MCKTKNDRRGKKAKEKGKTNKEYISPICKKNEKYE